MGHQKGCLVVVVRLVVQMLDCCYVVVADNAVILKLVQVMNYCRPPNLPSWVHPPHHLTLPTMVSVQNLSFVVVAVMVVVVVVAGSLVVVVVVMVVVAGLLVVVVVVMVVVADSLVVVVMVVVVVVAGSLVVVVVV